MPLVAPSALMKNRYQIISIARPTKPDRQIAAEVVQRRHGLEGGTAFELMEPACAKAKVDLYLLASTSAPSPADRFIVTAMPWVANRPKFGTRAKSTRPAPNAAPAVFAANRAPILHPVD